MLCVRCGSREAVADTVRHAALTEVEPKIPDGLCISCLAKDPTVQAHLRVRRERLLRTTESSAATVRNVVERTLEATGRVLHRLFGGTESSRAKQAQHDFEHQLQARGVDLRTLSPSAGVDAMLTFYRDSRQVGCDLDQQGDMLLYQWGTYDWGQGQHFEFDITRQLIWESGEDENIWQLSLTFRFPSVASLRALGSGNRWCPSPTELDAFEAFVRAHPAYAVVGNRSDAEIELSCERAG